MTVWSEGANQSLAYSFTMKMQVLEAEAEAEADIGTLDDDIDCSASQLRQPQLIPTPGAA